MKFNNQYFQAAGLYTIGNIFNKAISLLLLPILTRLLTPSSYGVVSTYSSWVNILTVIIGFQLYLTLRSAWTDKAADIDNYVATITLSVLVISSITLMMVYPVSLLVTRIPIALMYCCIIDSLCMSIVNIELQREMMALEYVKRTLLLSVPNLIAALLGIITLYLYPYFEYWGKIIPSLIVYLFFSLLILKKIFWERTVIINKQYCTYAFSYSTPLVFHGLANTILSGLDLSMITYYKGSGDTGIYSVVYTMGMAILVITSSLESVWIPWFTKAMNMNQKSRINQVVKLYIGIVTVLCTCVMLCLPEVCKLFTDRSYWSGIILIPPIVVASYIMFLYSISVDVEYYYKSTKIIAINTIIAAIINTALNFIFIPKYGIVAAAYTTVISYLISFVSHYLYASKLDSALFSFKAYLLPILIIIFGTVMTYLFINVWFYRWLLAILIGLVGFIYYYQKYKLKAYEI